jgi:hypothetical protein
MEITVAFAAGFFSTARWFGVSFSQRIVNSIFVVVLYVIAKQPEEMSFVQRDDMV